MNKLEVSHLELDHISVYYEHYRHPNADKTVVLLHGFLSSTFSFRRLIPLLCENFHVISIDLPPFGKSGKSRLYSYSYQNLAMTVIRLLEKLDKDKVILIGHSMGGQIALNVSYQKPELVEQIILLCSSGYLNRSKLSLTIVSYVPFFYLFVKFWLARSGVMKNLLNVVHDHGLIDDAMVSGYLHPFIQDNGIFKALTKMIRDREGDLSTEVLRQIETPCLLIWGEHDKVVPVQKGTRLNKDLKHSNMIILPNTGHLVPEERPEEIYHHIKQFTL
ncbi:alpha/beta fold hydrolase [Bacillus sp. CGMCC 1.16607]|uniref:alpha/beta fold hydrolase n=1 Tax=Bacillus sp. CGMCC 1.16607 TaxID=3351842 RepID=UPI0036449C82